MTLEVGPGRAARRGLHEALLPDRPPGVVTLGRERPARCFSPRGSSGSPVRRLDWSAFHTDSRRRRVPLPTYPFERKRYWVDRAAGATGRERARAVTPQSTTVVTRMTMPATRDPTDAADRRRDALVDRVRSLFADCPGMDAASLDTGAAFLELGLDSLFLTQAALLLQKTFGREGHVPRAAGGRSRRSTPRRPTSTALPPEAAARSRRHRARRSRRRPPGPRSPRRSTPPAGR